MTDPHTLVDNTVRDTPATHATSDPHSGHQTQRYDDGFRYSTQDNEDGHWTNQNEPKGSADRHTPPDDAKK